LLGGSSFVAVVKSADLWYRHDSPHFPLAESVTARANPLLRRDGFGIYGSSPNTNEEYDVGRLR